MTSTIACLLAVLATLRPPTLLPAQTKEGVTCEIKSIDVRTTVSWERDPAAPVVGRTLEMAAVASVAEGAALYVQSAFDIAEAVGPDGRNWLTPPKSPRKDWAFDRSQLRGRFASQLSNGRAMSARVHMRESVEVGQGLPAEFSRIRGWVDMIIATGTHTRPLEAGLVNEAFELAPGVNFLLTRLVREGEQVKIDYEVRIRRWEAPEKGRYEPIFAGLRLRAKDGSGGNFMHGGQEFETRDEYIMVQKNVHLDAAWLDRVGTIEAVAFDGIHTVRFELGADNVPVGGTP
ncbi:MAG: hypothetical protein IT433_01995 [Phycisphaerales bacterium]|nr:hypothetical protein [Phycisphaerales bacterium]